MGYGDTGLEHKFCQPERALTVGEEMRIEGGKARQIDLLTADLHLRTVSNVEPALGAKPNALTDIVLRRDAREVCSFAQIGSAGRDILLGKDCGLELQQHVGRLVEFECEGCVDLNGHRKTNGARAIRSR